ncbi:AroM family protein [Brevibacillus centrosporus]|uniref:AroM family protein n=1 Tax=Brevibacillus centrosporus TaxID=54910 RepID=UPI002E23925E|nr:AroM family protein [Brevibacillus centrosporus]
MKKVGMITIGQAPRMDIGHIIETYLDGRAELVQAGVLDGMALNDIQDKLSPGPGEYVLTSRLLDGSSVIMSRESIQPILQEKIKDMESRGISTTLLLCTGVFPGLHTERTVLVEPDQMLPPVIAGITKGRRLGVLVPLAEQVESLREKYTPHGLNPAFAVASPFKLDADTYRNAVVPLQDHVDILLLDCMGYTEEARQLVSDLTGLPVILSSALMAKILSEMI